MSIFLNKINRNVAFFSLLALGTFHLPASASTALGAYLPGDGWTPGEMEEVNSTLAKPLAIQNVFSAFTHTSVSYTHLTLPTTPYV